MLIKISWRNIWRNKRRTLIILCSIVVGTVSIILLDVFVNGMLDQMLDNQINSHISYVQIYKKGYNNNKIIQNFIPDYQKVENGLKGVGNIKNYCKRLTSFGLLNSASNSSGINIIGIEPENESRITIINKSLVKGNYLTGKKYEIIIGKKLAEKLEVDLGDKVVIMVAAFDGKMSSEIFRISGIYQTASSEFDKYFTYINLNQAQQMLGMENKVSELSIDLDDPLLVDNTKINLTSILGGPYEVFSYKDLIPNIVGLQETMRSLMIAFYIIIGIALIFGIINTMLMSVFERIREFGILMANGMKNVQIFKMIILEAVFLDIIGSSVGLILGLGIYLPLSKYGLDLSVVAESLSSMGFASIIYPRLTFSTLINSTLIILITTVLGSLYPAIKTVKLEPVLAIRSV